MFRSRRGRVPSEAALRVLRQVAYISSGTACGAAALIAEERRRQISVASKIVENSRRLKQHPRYHHTQVQVQVQVQSQQEPAVSHVDAFRSSVLPSEVDKGYTKFSQHETDCPSGKTRDATSSGRVLHQSPHPQPLTAPTTFRPSSLDANGTKRHLDVINRLAAASTSKELSSSILRLASQPCASGQLQYLCQRIYMLLAKADPHDVESFYLALFDHADHHDSVVQESKALVLQHLANHGRLSGSMSLFASIRKHQGKAEAFVQLDRCCQRLIVLGNPDAALDFFVTSTAWLDADNSVVCALSSRLFDALLKRHMSASCSRLLEWMHARIIPCDSHLHHLLRACASRHENNMLLSLYRTYQEHYPIPQDVFPALCAAASTIDPSLSASIFAEHIHLDNHNSVLPACEPAWSAILQSLWTRSRNIKLVDGTLKKIHRIIGTRQLNLDIYNAMIYICIDAGQVDRAQGYLRRIQKSDHIKPDIVTFGHFVLGAAKSSDWPAMDQLMLMLTRAGDKEASPDQRAHLFIPALLEYTKSHSPEQIWDFVSRAFDSYGLVPDQDISDVVITAFTNARRLDLVTPWINHMGSYGLDARPSPYISFKLMRQWYYDARPSHMVLMWLCRRLVKHIPENLSQSMVALLREAVSHDMRTYNRRSKHMTLQAKLRLQMLTNTGSTLPDPKYSFEFREPELQQQLADLGEDEEEALYRYVGQLAAKAHIPASRAQQDTRHKETARQAKSEAKRESEMLISISLSNPSRAVRLYRDSLSESGLPRSSYSLEMAVHAQVNGTNDGAKGDDGLIRTAQDAGVNTTAALLPTLLKQVQQSRPSSQTHVDNLYRTVLSFYQKMLTNNVTVRHHLATAAAEVLIQNEKPEDAIRLLAGIFHSQWAEQVPLDMPAMTTFLKAYIMARHKEGIDWVVNQVLNEKYRIDRPFIVVLDNAHRYYRREVNRATDASNPSADKSSALADATLHLSQVCKKRQAEQKTNASRFGNRLVHLLIKMAKRPEAIEAPSDLTHLDPSLLGRGLRDKDGHRRKYRLYVTRNERAWRRMDNHARKRRSMETSSRAATKAHLTPKRHDTSVDVSSPIAPEFPTTG